jgi:hypothetical protein
LGQDKGKQRAKFDREFDADLLAKARISRKSAIGSSRTCDRMADYCQGCDGELTAELTTGEKSAMLLSGPRT